jgi:hypothetical protein
MKSFSWFGDLTFFHALCDIMRTASSGTHEPLGQSFASCARKGTITSTANASSSKPLQLSARISKHWANMVS